MRHCLAALAAATLGASAALAQPPSPINPVYHSFPGAHAHPASARSAGLALANRWLGEEPWDNPAGAGARSLTLTGALLHNSRQDLRRQNRRFEEQSVFLDAAGGSVGWSAGGLGLTLYASQPVLRVEDNAFSRGIDPTAEPAAITTGTTVRELRAGLAIAWGGERLRIGAAGEWTQRQDRYELVEQSGSPASGSRVAEFSGDGFGGSAGVRIGFGEAAPGAIRVGAALRWIPAIAVTGDQSLELLAGTSGAAISAEREAGWEAGGTVSVVVTAAFQALLALGGRGEQAWEGFGVTRGAGSEWSVGGEYHDARDPWIARFGFGIEEERGVPEPRSRRIAFGAAWLMDSTTLDFGILHRSIERPGQPDSSEDRVLVGVVQKF